MDIKVNQVNQTAPVETKSQTPVTDDGFKFTLINHIQESELQEKLQLLMQEITTEGEKLAKRRCKGYEALQGTGQGVPE